MTSRPNLLPLLTMLTAIGIVAATIYLPSFPDLARELDVPIGGAQITLAVYLIGLALGQLVLGPLSDRYGRRRVLAGGLGLCIMASLACALAQSIEVLILARFAQALGACVGMVVTRAVIRDLYERREAACAVSLVGIALALAPALAPIIGGFSHELWGWRANFVIVALLAGLALALTVRRLPETNLHLQVQHSLLGGFVISFRHLLGSKGFLAFALVMGGMFAALYAFVAGAPALIIERLGVGPANYGLIVALPTIGYLIGTAMSSRFTLRFGLERMTDIGTALLCLSGIGMAAIALTGHVSAAGAIAPMMLWAIGFGMALPNCIAGAVSIAPRIAGAASALSGFLQMAGGALGTAVAFALPKGNAIGLALSVAGFSLFVLAVWRALRRHAQLAPL